MDISSQEQFQEESEVSSEDPPSSPEQLQEGIHLQEDPRLPSFNNVYVPPSTFHHHHHHHHQPPQFEFPMTTSQEYYNAGIWNPQTNQMVNFTDAYIASHPPLLPINYMAMAHQSSVTHSHDCTRKRCADGSPGTPKPLYSSRPQLLPEREESEVSSEDPPSSPEQLQEGIHLQEDPGLPGCNYVPPSTLHHRHHPPEFEVPYVSMITSQEWHNAVIWNPQTNQMVNFKDFLASHPPLPPIHYMGHQSSVAHFHDCPGTSFATSSNEHDDEKVKIHEETPTNFLAHQSSVTHSHDCPRKRCTDGSPGTPKPLYWPRPQLLPEREESEVSSEDPPSSPEQLQEGIHLQEDPRLPGFNNADVLPSTFHHHHHHQPPQFEFPTTTSQEYYNAGIWNPQTNQMVNFKDAFLASHPALPPINYMGHQSSVTHSHDCPCPRKRCAISSNEHGGKKVKIHEETPINYSISNHAAIPRSSTGFVDVPSRSFFGSFLNVEPNNATQSLDTDIEHENIWKALWDDQIESVDVEKGTDSPLTATQAEDEEEEGESFESWLESLKRN